jgi:hypothetical protein
MKFSTFFATATIVVASLIALAAPAVAQSIVWEGRYQNPQQVDGGWKVTDPKKGKVIFATCEGNRSGPSGRGWYCHTLIQKGWDGFGGGNTTTVTTKVQVASTSDLVNSGEILYAIFRPTAMGQLGLSDNLFNLTDNDKGAAYMSKIRALCQANPDKCEFASATNHDVMAAAMKVHKLHPNWRLF